MKENVLDVLMYLFDNYMDEENDVKSDRESLAVELQEAGFSLQEVNKALSWLEGLSTLQQSNDLNKSQNRKSIRVFSEQEKKKLDSECMSFILFLDNIGAFDLNIREMIIDRVMALETNEIDLEQLKWVILLVLFNQPGQEAAFAWIEDVVFEEFSSSVH
jgi:Smg protein